VTAAGLIRSRGLCGRGWSLVALGLCLAAVAGTLEVVAESDSRDFRWWLLALPVGSCVASVLMPVRTLLIAATIVMTGWCALSAASVGMFYVSALVALVLAVGRTQ
jgi:hypothetical protein